MIGCKDTLPFVTSPPPRGVAFLITHISTTFNSRQASYGTDSWKPTQKMTKKKKKKKKTPEEEEEGSHAVECQWSVLEMVELAEKGLRKGSKKIAQ